MSGNGAPFPYSSPAEASPKRTDERHGRIAELVRAEIARSEAKRPFKPTRRRPAPTLPADAHDWRYTPNSGLARFDPMNAEGA